jgi:hypothetical protein
MKKLNKRATISELMAHLDKSDKTIRRYIARAGLVPDAQKKYSSAAVLEQEKVASERDLRNKGSLDGILVDPQTWGDQLKAKQVEKLDVQIQELRGELISKDDVRGILATHASAVRGALDNFVQMVAAKKRDADLLKWAEEMRDAAINAIRDEL